MYSLRCPACNAPYCHWKYTVECSIFPHIAHLSQLKICDFSGEDFKGFEVIQFSMSATTTQLLSSGESCKLRYDTIPVKKVHLQNVSFYTNNSKIAKF